MNYEEAGTVKNTRNLTLSALFLALGLMLPFLTMNIPRFGSMLLPMHLPVLLCGFVCGWPWGLAVGFITPLLRSVLVGMPPILPTALAMAFELAAYGALTGLLYRALPRKVWCLYASLIAAMLGGRIVWGVAMAFIAGANFGAQAFIAGAFANAVPGIILQIILIPALILALRRAKLID
jgi:predicted membrane protein